MSATPSVPAGGRGAATGLVTMNSRRAVPVFLVRGGLAIAFGLLALLWPAVTILVLALVFGVYAVADGVSAIVHALRHGDRPHRWVTFAGGLFSVVAGAIALVWPGITVLALVVVIGVWAVFTGVAEGVAVIRLRHQIRGALLLGVGGAISAIAGVLILLQPLAGAVGIALVIGVYALVYGVLMLVLAGRLRRRYAHHVVPGW
jgi:uncharacterized membrane protein HdeD (DUF308 family)